MTEVMRELFKQAFLLGPYRPREQSASSRFTSRQGLLIAAIGKSPTTTTQRPSGASLREFWCTGLCSLLCPKQVGESMGNKAAASGEAAATGLIQFLRVLNIAIGYFNYAGGRANCEWFTAVAIVEKLGAAAFSVGLYLHGTILLQTVVTQVVLDGSIALCTLYLWQQDLTQHTETLKQAKNM